MNQMAQRLLQEPDVQLQIEHMQQSLRSEAAHRHAFREMLTEDMKAEFINGEVIMHSPVKRKHLDVSARLGWLLQTFATIKHLGTVWLEKALVSLTRNDYEPDICFYLAGRLDGFGKDQMLFPAPDFVVEILSRKTARYDKTIKKKDYAAHGVREYWIIDADKQTITQYYLLDETETSYFFERVFRVGEDIESKVIAGFVIPVEAIFEAQANAEAFEALVRNDER